MSEIVFCPFCAIAAQSESGATILESDRALAFLDRQPIRPGHTLVIPKTHIARFHDLDDDLLVELTLLGRRVARALDRTYSPRRVGFLVPGFDVDHAHLHVLPLHDSHYLTSKALLDGTRGTPESAELAQEATRVVRNLEP